MKKPRKPCPVCRKSTAIHNGRFNKHKANGHKCPGSGKPG